MQSSQIFPRPLNLSFVMICRIILWSGHAKTGKNREKRKNQQTIRCQVLAQLNKIWSCLIFIKLYQVPNGSVFFNWRFAKLVFGSVSLWDDWEKNWNMKSDPKMKAERARYRSSSTLSSFSGTETTNCYRQVCFRFQVLFCTLKKYNGFQSFMNSIRQELL